MKKLKCKKMIDFLNNISCNSFDTQVDSSNLNEIYKYYVQ